MPSIYDALKRIIQGKPVFDTETPAQDGVNPAAPATAPQEPQTTIQKNNDSTFPVAYVARTESRPNGQNVQIYCFIKNGWNSQLDVEAIRLLDTERKLKISLRPGEQREMLVYSGPSLVRQQGSEALLIYKTESGDYFEAVHEIHYAYTPEKFYQVTELRFHPPVRDIYG